VAAGMFVIGAAAAYLMDLRSGKRRRALVCDKALYLLRKSKASAHHTLRNFRNHFAGLRARWSALTPAGKPSDRKLECQIRTKLGRLVSHPHSIRVDVEHGGVSLRGLVLAEEAERLVATVRLMQGVDSVKNELLVCKQPAHISGLQGGRPRGYPRRQWRYKHWSPIVRLAAVLVGALGFFYGIARRDEPGLWIAVFSAAILLKGFADHFWGVRNEAIEFEDTIRIYAPLSDVFDFWKDPRNYPRAMSHVLNVEKVGENLYHWTVRGPGGKSLGWDAIITDNVPNTLISWKSIEGSLVRNEGTAFLDPIYDGSTRLHLKMWYQPPGGLAGRVIAAALGADPARIIRNDLHQFKLAMERYEKPAKLELRRWAV